MRYSNAFKKLLAMSLDIDDVENIKRSRQYRVAIFLGRIKIAEAGFGSLEGIAKYKGYKTEALQHLVAMTDTEWKMVRELMEEQARSSLASVKWRAMRTDWVRALDTLRAFS